MQRDASLAHPLTVVFDHLAAPSHLGDWLPDVLWVEETRESVPGIGLTFALTLRVGESDHAAMGELIAYEPPAMLAFRLFVGDLIHVLRLSCAASAAGTRLRIQQAGGGDSLTVDLARLEQALALLGATRGEERLRDTPIMFAPQVQPEITTIQMMQTQEDER